MTTADFKANFSSVVDELKHGNKVIITYGRKKEPLATIIPQSQLTKPNYSVELGDLKSQNWTYTLKDFDMTEEEFVNSWTQWEISLKFAVGKLELGKHTPDEFLAGIYKIGLKDITPSPEQWSTYYLLPKIKDHRDPFDRMIIWLAIQSGMTLLSSDSKFDKYKPHGLSLV